MAKYFLAKQAPKNQAKSPTKRDFQKSILNARQLQPKNLLVSAVLLAFTYWFWRRKNIALMLVFLSAFFGHNLFPEFVPNHTSQFIAVGVAMLNGVYYTLGIILFYITKKPHYKHI